MWAVEIMKWKEDTPYDDDSSMHGVRRWLAVVLPPPIHIHTHKHTIGIGSKKLTSLQSSCMRSKTSP